MRNQNLFDATKTLVNGKAFNKHLKKVPKEKRYIPNMLKEYLGSKDYEQLDPNHVFYLQFSKYPEHATKMIFESFMSESIWEQIAGKSFSSYIALADNVLEFVKDNELEDDLLEKNSHVRFKDDTSGSTVFLKTYPLKDSDVSFSQSDEGIQKCFWHEVFAERSLDPNAINYKQPFNMKVRGDDLLDITVFLWPVHKYIEEECLVNHYFTPDGYVMELLLDEVKYTVLGKQIITDGQLAVHVNVFDGEMRGISLEYFKGMLFTLPATMTVELDTSDNVPEREVSGFLHPTFMVKANLNGEVYSPSIERKVIKPSTELKETPTSTELFLDKWSAWFPHLNETV